MALAAIAIPRLRRFAPPLGMTMHILTALPLGALLAQTPECAARVDSSSSALDSAVVSAMREYAVPGAALAIVRDGKVEHLAGYGCANRARGIPVDPRTTVFHVASVSKPFVALAALTLVERGAIDLHADVNRYLTGVRVPAGWDRPVTIHDLLTHTAGFDESVVGYAARTPAEVRPLGAFLAVKLPRRGWAPGQVTGYSNYGYALAGYVVESVSRVSFADYVHNAVIAPLGMRRSSFAQPPPEDLARDAALSYRCTQTTCTPIEPDYRSAYPPGGLVTTADDMSRFLLAELGSPLDGKRVLSDSVLHLMQMRQFTHDSVLRGMTYGFAEDVFAGTRALSHAGSSSGYLSAVFVVPDRRTGFFLVANGGATAFGGAVKRAVERALFPASLADPPLPAPSDASIDPTGDYRLTRYAHRGIENLPMLFNGQLHVRRLTGDTIVVSGLGDANGRYIGVAPNRWRSIDGTNVVAVRAANGAVTHFFGPLSFFGTQFPAAFERLAWYDEPHFLNELLSYAAGVPLLALLAWPIVAGLVWLVRRRTRFVAELKPETSGAHWRRLAVVAAVVSTALTLWFGFGFIAATNRAAERGGGEIIYGLPPVMRVLAWAPTALAALATILVFATLAGWRRRWWSIPGLVLFTIIEASALLFVAILIHWGYFPVATG
jgi:CubicO group peptidase (beta-lactamase class C family)